MLRYFGIIMALIIVLAGAFAAPGSTGAQSTMSNGCYEFGSRYGASSIGFLNEFWAGETITIEVVAVMSDDLWDEVYFRLDGTDLVSALYPYDPISYTFSTTMSGMFSFGVTGVEPGVMVIIDTTCTPAPGGGGSAPSAGTVPANVPGCDMLTALPDDAAVGVFLAETGILWGPGADMATGLTMPAGKTAWVLGMDESGQFYKFVFSCSYLWAPVRAMGINHDDVWNGAPLPVTVVE